jgi:hypothetical protein
MTYLIVLSCYLFVFAIEFSDLIADPLRAATVTDAEMIRLMGEIEYVRNLLAAVLASRATQATSEPESASDQDHLLTVEEAASILAVPPQWLYRRYKRLGLGVKLDNGTLRFSRKAIETYIGHHPIDLAPTRKRKA